MANITTSGFDDIVPANIGKPIRLVGIIGGKKKSGFKATTMVFKCNECGQETSKTEEIWEDASSGKERCKDCGSESLHVTTEGSDFHRYQVARLVELPEHANALTQRQVDVILTGKQTECKVGERIIIDGTIRKKPAKNIHHAWKEILGNLAVIVESVEPFKIELEPGRIKEIEAFANARGDNAIFYYDGIAREVFPRIKGMDRIKRAMLLATVGGAVKKTDRGLIHVLLIGDHGVAMSPMLGSLSKINKRYFYVGQGGVSGIGLTAYVVKNEKNVELKSGAIPLVNGGSVVIDEFDKMRKEDSMALYEQMSNAKISVDKWGIHETLEARTSIIATTKDEKMVPKAILDRFDIILPTEDEQAEEKSIHDDDFFADLIHHAKTTVETVDVPEDILDEMKKRIMESAKDDVERIRTLESFHRIVTASARGRLHGKADESDLELAWGILTAGKRGDHPWNDHPLTYWTKEDEEHLQEMKRKQKREKKRDK